MSWLENPVLVDVFEERLAQEQKFPNQHLPDGTGAPGSRGEANIHRDITDSAAFHGQLTWAHVLTEEFYEALAESDPKLLRAELLQVAAVAARWAEDIDRRTQTCPYAADGAEHPTDCPVHDPGEGWCR